MLNQFLKFLILIITVSALFFSSRISLAQTQTNNNEQELFLVSEKAFEDGFYDVAIRYIDQLMKRKFLDKF